MSSSNNNTIITPISKGGGTVIQRRQRNTNTAASRASASTTSSSLSYNTHPQQQHHHNSYYYGGSRGAGGSTIDGGSSFSSSIRERLLSSTNSQIPTTTPQPPTSQLYTDSPQDHQPQPHLALHIDNYDHNNNNHNRYYNCSSDNNHHYDPEQPQQLHSPSTSYPTHRMTEEQIRRFNDNNYEQQQHQHQTSNIPNYDYHTTTATTVTTPTTTVASAKKMMIPIWKRKMVLEEDFYRIEDYHTIFRNPHHMTDAQYTKYVQLQQQYSVHGNNNNGSSHKNGATGTTGTSMMNKTCCAYTCSMFSALAVFFLLWVGILLDTQPMYIPGALPTITVQSVTQQQQQQQEPPYSSTTNQRNDYKQRQQKGQGRQQQQKQSQPRRTTPRIQFIIPGKNDERLFIAKTAYQAATMYFITMIISRYIYDPIPFHTFYNTYIVSLFQRCYGRIFTGQRRFSQRHTYTDIPELQSQYDMIGHYASNTEGLILSGGGVSSSAATNGGNGITLLPYATSASNMQQQRSVLFSTATTSLWTRTSNTMKRYLASKGWYQPSRRRNRHHYEIKKTG